MGIPGQQYFAGTHLNPLVTWWSRSGAFFDYINRSQWMLMQGRFVADVLYYYGDHVPNYTQLRASNPTGLGVGYDYDVITEEALLSRVSVEGGWLVLPDGTRYRMLALPPHETISLPARLNSCPVAPLWALMDPFLHQRFIRARSGATGHFLSISCPIMVPPEGLPDVSLSPPPEGSACAGAFGSSVTFEGFSPGCLRGSGPAPDS